ncbi:MAG: hypothetical protein WCK92_00380 [Bacteroidota bacterium]
MDNYKLQISPGITIQLRKPKIKESRYELAIGEEVVGTIVLPKMFGTLAYVSSAKQEWSLERKGFWKSSIILRKKGEETDLLKITVGKMSRRLLSFTSPKGEVYDLMREGFWGKSWIWTKNNMLLMRLHMKDGMKRSGEVAILNNDPMDAILMLAATYALILKNRDEAASAVAVTAAVG